MINDIDFVVMWVDGNDPAWLKEKAQYDQEHGDKRNIRFRDWDNLHYLFRGFEVFAPWVRTIHFVTWGHLPKWLNTHHPKLNIVYHHEYLNKKDLPVFNAHALEINLHRIEGLAEKFVYFNDDTFLVKDTEPHRFFSDELPRDMMVANALSSSDGVGHFVLNDLEILNRHFDKRAFMRTNLGKYFNPKYGKNLLRNVALLLWSRYTGFVDPHMPQPFLKSTFEAVWAREHKQLARISASRFRHCDDVNQYLFRYWQLASGQFKPVSFEDAKYMTIEMEAIRSGMVEKTITSGQYNMICLNDDDRIQTAQEFAEAKKVIQQAFEKILPYKSEFEIS